MFEPLIIQAGYDPVWFGILLVLLIQTAMVSPPFGINLFVIHGIRGRGRLSDVEIGSRPRMTHPWSVLPIR